MIDENQTADSDGKHAAFQNEIKGYNIIPDSHNWTVVIVQKYGAKSKHVGKEYSRPIAYCRTLEQAAKFILNYDSRRRTEMVGLIKAFEEATAEVVKTVHEVARNLETSKDVDSLKII